MPQYLILNSYRVIIKIPYNFSHPSNKGIFI